MDTQSSTRRSRVSRFLTSLVITALATTSALTGALSFADMTGGAAGSGGSYSGGVNGSNWSFRFATYQPAKQSNGTLSGTYKTDDAYSIFRALDGWSSVAYSTTSAYSIESTFYGAGGGDPTCQNALQQAIINNDAGDENENNYRVALIGSFVGSTTSGGAGLVPYHGSPGAGVFANAFQTAWTDALSAQFTDPSVNQIVYNLASSSIPSNGNRVCVVLHESQVPDPNYTLNVSTTAQNTFALSGNNNAVHDSVTLSTDPAGNTDTVDVETVLHYDSFPGGPEAKAVSKVKAMPVNGTTASDTFTPSDFGWSEWPAGTYWYDTIIPKQGNMASAVDTPDRVASESWTAEFQLNVRTQAMFSGGSGQVNAYDTLATSSDATYVRDIIYTDSNNSGYSGKLTADITLNWDGAGDTPARSATKTIELAADGQTWGPNFTPTDLGFVESVTWWPAGTFWFDVKVNKQSLMNTTVDTPDRETNETWHLEPEPPHKALLKLASADDSSGDKYTFINDTDVLASGMFYTARISAANAGYSSLTLQDIIFTDDVVIGARDEDDASQVYMMMDVSTATNPEIVKVEDAQISIEREDGKVIVSGTIPSIAPEYRASNVYLFVPTYVRPTGSDYEIEDESRVIYSDKSLDGDTGDTRKITPAPDKVWVLDESGALTAYDKDWTNKIAADTKVFLQNDDVSAVVNGRISGNFVDNLYAYSITDDWSDAMKYVDFSDTSKVKVFYETGFQSNEFADVTSQFTITTKNGVTTATATPKFLYTTRGSDDVNNNGNANVYRRVKLVLTGSFRDDYDTDGQLVTLVNKGSETWNNETIATNEPPVFTWTPNPEKQVRGSAEQDGVKTYADINGQLVFPGQKLEYTVGIDVRVPSNTARGVKTLAVRDTYDPMFIPDKRSVEIWDSRDATNPKPVAASNYTLEFDDETYSFLVTFKQDWIDKNVNVDGANSEWLTKGWLTMRFTGTVDSNAEDAEVIENIAYEIINGAAIATEEPIVTVPEWEPHKEDLNTEGVDIDGKTVVSGDVIVYRLTMDAHFTQDQLAYYVHKLGIIDDYDDEYLDVQASSIRVTDKDTGTDVTDKFNVQVKNGVVYVFAKQVDFTTYDGTVVKGDPQPTDLAEYASAKIVNGETPVIDQTLLGHTYYVTFQGKVLKDTDGYVIKNQGTEIVENSQKLTEIVTNPLKEINPDKDIVVDEETKNRSINGQEIPLYADFNYRLNSSKIPANRAYKASQWSLTDQFDRTHDEYTGVWAVYANNDIYDGTTLVYKKGDLLQDSAGHESNAMSGLFDVTFDETSYTFKIEATQKFLDLVNSRMDRVQSFSVYTKMIRIAPGDKIENVVTETYNNVDRASNVVWTSTPEHPSIDVEKFTLSEGETDGDRDTVDDAFKMSKPTSTVEVGFVITNTGDVPLKNITFEDTTLDGLSGTVENITCEVPVEGSDELAQVKPEEIGKLAVAQSVNCKGELTGMTYGAKHGDNVKVTGQSVFTDQTVEDNDPWYAVAPEQPPVNPLAKTGAMGTLGISLISGMLAVIGTSLLVYRRYQSRQH